MPLCGCVETAARQQGEGAREVIGRFFVGEAAESARPRAPRVVEGARPESQGSGLGEVIGEVGEQRVRIGDGMRFQGFRDACVQPETLALAALARQDLPHQRVGEVESARGRLTGEKTGVDRLVQQSQQGFSGDPRRAREHEDVEGGSYEGSHGEQLAAFRGQAGHVSFDDSQHLAGEGQRRIGPDLREPTLGGQESRQFHHEEGVARRLLVYRPSQRRGDVPPRVRAHDSFDIVRTESAEAESSTARVSKGVEGPCQRMIGPDTALPMQGDHQHSGDGKLGGESA